MRTIQSVDRAMLLLSHVAEHDGKKNLTELSKDLGLPVTTLHAFVATLEQWGMIRKDPQTGKYFLGEKVLQLGMRCSRETALKSLVHPFLEELQRQAGETVHLVVSFGPDYYFYLDSVESTNPMRLTSLVGTTEAMGQSAIGAVLTYSLEPQSSKNDVFEVRQWEGNPYCCAQDERMGICCLAMSFPYAMGGPYAALTVALPASRQNGEQKQKCGQALLDAVRKIRIQLAT